MNKIIPSCKLVITLATSLTMFGYFVPSVSLADDSLTLKKLLSSIQTSSQSEKLTNQISSILLSSKKDTEQIQCTGTKSNGRYSSISNAIAPFNCQFPNQLTLTITATNFVILPSGRAIPIQKAKNFNLMPKPISLSYQVTSWNWKKAPSAIP